MTHSQEMIEYAKHHPCVRYPREGIEPLRAVRP